MKEAILSTDDLARAHLHARTAAASARLPFRSRVWRGPQGNWQGAGTGSSLDFQDHRPYAPGDDPRYINWQAYARTGSYTMKLYRQEASPAVDLVVDRSPSMFLDPAKAARTAELFYWTAESALECGAALRIYTLSGEETLPIALDELFGHTWLRPETAAFQAESLRGIPWRHGAMRLLLSDLLWPGHAQPICHSLCEGNGFGIIFAPFSAAEADPIWDGNLEMTDCETGELRLQRVDRDSLGRYRESYQRHFSFWADECARYGIPLARVSADASLSEALEPHMAAAGAVEWGG